MSVSAVIFCKQFLAYTVHIDWCYHSIHEHLVSFSFFQILIKLQCIVGPISIDSNRQALQTNGKLFSNFGIIF